MEKNKILSINAFFTKILPLCVICILVISVFSKINSIFFENGFVNKFYIGTAIFSVSTLCIFLVYKLSNLKYILWLIIPVSFVIRIISCIYWKIEPVSDFDTTYRLSSEIAQIPFSSWINHISQMNTEYTTRWSAHFPFVMYQAFIMKILGIGIFKIQLVNCIASSLTGVFIAFCAKEISSNKNASFLCFLWCINPTSIFFMPVLSNQHIATMFFTLFLWLFLKSKNKIQYIILSSISLALSQLMRPEMYVILIAVAIYFIYCSFNEKKFLKNLINALIFIFIFFIILFCVNEILIQTNMVHNSIMNGNLKYKLTIGLNQNTGGIWSQADGALIDFPEKLNQVFSERITDIGSISLILKKITVQFGQYFYGWSLNDEHKFISYGIYIPLAQSFMTIIIILFALFRLRSLSNNKALVPIYIMLAGFIAVFGLIEIQDRYNYIILPMLIICSFSDTYDINKKNNILT